jgi:pseudouridine kinase
MAGTMVNSGRNQVIVVGGSCVDVKAVAESLLVSATSNPGRVRITFGGVARNVAENLARLDVPVGLITAIGDDVIGRALAEQCVRLGIDCRFSCQANTATDLYSAVLAPDGELVVAVAAMPCVEGLDDVLVSHHKAFLSSAKYLVCDANLSPAALLSIGQIAQVAHIPFVVEPVSVSKAAKLKLLVDANIPVALMTPNRAELAIIAGQAIKDDNDIATACRHLRERSVEVLIVGLGKRGAFVAAPGLETLVGSDTDQLCDVTGAGDAALAATLWALNRNDDWLVAARAGQYAAGLTVATQATVSESMSAMYLSDRMTRNQ